VSSESVIACHVCVHQQSEAHMTGIVTLCGSPSHDTPSNLLHFLIKVVDSAFGAESSKT
jgi:hypothetical protein